MTLTPEEFERVADRLGVEGTAREVLKQFAVFGTVTIDEEGREVPDLPAIAENLGLPFYEVTGQWEALRERFGRHEWERFLFGCVANRKARGHSPPPPNACEDEYLRGMKDGRVILGPYRVKPIRGPILTPRDYAEGERDWREAGAAAQERKQAEEQRRAARRVRVTEKPSVCERRAAILKALFDEPEKSDRVIARSVGVDGKTVGAMRECLVSAGLIPRHERTVGADGRVRPARVANAGSTNGS